ncbi:hypothetical protein bcere0017_29390 [Bacillus cereus Rock1-3]|nr:hypothetical protein bcere0017_29390 [Bacillus cereus Rock1-3]
MFIRSVTPSYAVIHTQKKINRKANAVAIPMNVGGNLKKFFKVFIVVLLVVLL